MANFEIKSWRTGAVLYSGEAESLRDLVGTAVRADAVLNGANLNGANLSGADLSDADLRRADLSDANLSDANLSDANLSDANLRRAVLSGADLSDAVLSGADLRRADLSGADLSDANLSDANLSDANLSDANLRRAVLSGADLSDAVLSGADLSGADLRRADLSGVIDDLRAVLDAAPAEVPGLLAALRAGKVDGSTYEGECACLVGTIANTRGCDYRQVTGLAPDAWRPAERWFLAIRPGHMPENSPIAKLTAEWIEQWLSEHGKSADGGEGD